MSRSEAIKFVLVRSIGNFLLLMSLYGVFMTFGPVVYHEVQFRVAQARGVTFKVASESHNLEDRKPTNQAPKTENRQPITENNPSFADILAGAKEQVLVPKDPDFSIVIPKIGASARVFPNVNPGNPEEFKPILKQGVAHAGGTVFPGMQGNTYLFAHSAANWWDIEQYNAVFYLLKDLSAGDEVTVFFEGVRYDYGVTKSFIADDTDVSLLTEHTDKEQLVLQTCWPPGTTFKRQFVIAEPLSKIQNYPQKQE